MNGENKTQQQQQQSQKQPQKQSQNNLRKKTLSRNKSQKPQAQQQPIPEYQLKQKEKIENIYLPKLNLHNQSKQSYTNSMRSLNITANTNTLQSPQSCPVQRENLEVNSLTSLNFTNRIKYEQPFFKSQKRNSKSSDKFKIFYKKVDKSASDKKGIMLFQDVVVKYDTQKMEEASMLYGTPIQSRQKKFFNKMDPIVEKRLMKKFNHIDYNSNGRRLQKIKDNIQQDNKDKEKQYKETMKFIKNADKQLENKKYSSKRTVEVSKVQLKPMSKNDMAIVNNCRSKQVTQI